VVLFVAGLLLAAFTCIDVLNLTQTYVWLDLTQSPHMGSVQHAKPKTAEINSTRAMQPAHAIMPPLPFVSLLLVLLWFVVLPRAPAVGARYVWRPRVRGPPFSGFVGARL
jgi:hypothetical protein